MRVVAQVAACWNAAAELLAEEAAGLGLECVLKVKL